MYIPEVFKYATPVKAMSLIGKLGNNMQYILNQVSPTKTLLSVYKTDSDGTFEKGYVIDNLDCNLQQISIESQKSTDLSIVHDNCKGIIHKLSGIFINPESNQASPIFPQELIIGENSAIISSLSCSEETKIGDYDFLSLKDYDVETATNTVLNYYREYKDCLQSLIPTTTPEPLVSVLSGGLEALGISVENLTPTEIGKNILNALNIPFTDPTTTTAEDTNEDGYTGAYIAAGIVGGLAIGTALGYGIKYGIDWYKGKNKAVKHDEENQLLNINSELYKIKDFIPLLIKTFKELSESDEKYEDIKEGQSLNEEVNYEKLIPALYKFTKSLKQDNDICNALKEVKTLYDQGNTQTPAYDQKILNLQDLLCATSDSGIHSRLNDSVSTIGESIDDLS